MGNSGSTRGGGQQVSPPPDRTAQPAALPLTEDVLKKHEAAGSDEEEVSGCAALAARGAEPPQGALDRLPPAAAASGSGLGWVIVASRVPQGCGGGAPAVVPPPSPGSGCRDAGGSHGVAGGRRAPAGSMSMPCRRAASGPHAAAAASGARAAGVSDRFPPIAGLLQSPPPVLLVYGSYPFWLHLKARSQAPPPACPPSPLCSQERESFASWRSNSAPSSARPSRPSSARPSTSSRGRPSVETMTPMSGVTNDWDQRPSADTPLPGASSGYKGGWQQRPASLAERETVCSTS